MYAVCKTPNCQQTYPIGEIVEALPEGLAKFCDICNGEVVSKTGYARLSQNPHVITVVGNRLLNALYKNNELYSMRLKIDDNKVLTWSQGDSYKEFMFLLKQEIRPFNPKIELTQGSIDDSMVNTDILYTLLKHGIDVKRNLQLYLV